MSSALLLVSLLAVSSASDGAAVRAPLVAAPVDHQLTPVARGDDDEDDDGTPEGCLTWWLCYQMPSAEQAHPWIEDNKWRFLIVEDIAKFGLSFIGIPLVAVWLPFVVHFLLVDEDVRPSMSGRVLWVTLIGIGLNLVTAYGLLPLLFIPGLGYVAYVVINGTLNYWIIPATSLHAYNTAMKEADGEQPRKKKRRARRDDDEEYEEEDDEEEERPSRSDGLDPEAETWGTEPAESKPSPAEPAPAQPAPVEPAPAEPAPAETGAY